MDGWRPIETAPKDGTWVAVTSTHNPYCRGVVQWKHAAWRDWHDEPVSWFDDTVTHWMPLPEITPLLSQS